MVAAVSDIFSFVCKHAEFTKSILFAETEITEIRPEERKAIAAVSEHVRQSYVALLEACRDDMYRRADAELQATMGRNWNRPDSIWTRARVELPLLIESSYVLVAYFWIDEEPTSKDRLSLVGGLWAQKRRRALLLEAASRAAPTIYLADGQNPRVIEDIVEGQEFADLARRIVSPLWPVAVDARAALIAYTTESPSA